MGDVIHTLPALTDAQRSIPDLQVDWVIEKSFSEIPHWHSAVRNVIPVEIRRWRRNLFKSQTWQEWKIYKQVLQAEKYDAVIDAQGLIKSAVFATRLTCGKKYGYDRNSAREALSSLFYDKTFAIPYQQHAVERIRQLFAAALGYQLNDEVGDYDIARHFVKKSEESTSCKPYIVAVHATTRDDKHWLESYWAELFELCGRANIDVRLPWGNESEKARAERLVLGKHIHVLPKMGLKELACELANAKAVVSVDTGLSHLTAALDTPNVILYGATDPKLIGAYGKNQVYLQENGMQNIQPQQVWQALERILDV